MSEGDLVLSLSTREALEDALRKLSSAQAGQGMRLVIIEERCAEIAEIRKELRALSDRMLVTDTQQKVRTKTLSAVWVALLGAVGAFGGLVVWMIQKLLGNGHGPVGK